MLGTKFSDIFYISDFLYTKGNFRSAFLFIFDLYVKLPLGVGDFLHCVLK